MTNSWLQCTASIPKHSSAYSDVACFSMTCSAILSVTSCSSRNNWHDDIVHWSDLALMCHYEQCADSVIMHAMPVHTQCWKWVYVFRLGQDLQSSICITILFFFMPCQMMIDLKVEGQSKPLMIYFSYVDCIVQWRVRFCGKQTINAMLTTRLGGDNWIAVVHQKQTN